MKAAPLTLLFVCAAPARGDVAVPAPTTSPPAWADRCVARIDQAAGTVGLAPGARRDVLPLVREDGTPDPMQRVSFAVPDGLLLAAAGTDNEAQADKRWTRTAGRGGGLVWFRRHAGRWAKIDSGAPRWTAAFKAALDDCLQMGDLK